jgi:hypothetical protein
MAERHYHYRGVAIVESDTDRRYHYRGIAVEETQLPDTRHTTYQGMMRLESDTQRQYTYRGLMVSETFNQPSTYEQVSFRFRNDNGGLGAP